MRPEVVLRRARRGALCMRRAGLGQEVLDDHLLDVAVAAVARRRWPPGRRSGRPRSSPMPTRIPVVNGMAELAGGLERGQAAGRHLVGGAAVAVEVGRGGDSTIIPWLGDDRPQHAPARPEDSAPALAWGSRPVSLEHQRGHRRRGSRRCWRSRGRRASRRPPGSAPRARSPRVNSASWQPAAAPARAMAEHLLGASGTATRAGPAAGRRCSSRSGRGTASSGG